MAEKKKKNPPKSKLRKWIIATWLVFMGGIGVFVLFILAVAHGWGPLDPLPSTTQLENPESDLATEVFSADGKIIGKYFLENRSDVGYDEISQYVYQALVATEDVRFYKHSGIDKKGLIRAIVYRGKEGGGSTVTQQLAKNMFGRQRFSNIWEIGVQKMREWILAVELEKRYTKEEILYMYLNTVELGSNTFGIKSASKTFFNKEPINLNIQESAVLVGMLKAITKYNPYFNPEDSKARRNTVLSQMYKYGYIKSQAEFDSIKALPIVLDYNVESHNQGIARYFREELRAKLSAWCEENGYNLYKDGLKVYTTIDSRMQMYAEQATREHMAELQATFYKRLKGRRKAPFDYRLSQKQINNLIDRSIKRTDRYRLLKAKGKSWEEILANFKMERKMKLFSYQGDVDTTLSPYDSIKYYKWFLNPGFLAIENGTGYIKAWVGGIDYKYFKYDHVNKRAKRQVGSTFKPFLYATAILNGYSPCLSIPNVQVVFPEFDNWKPKNSDGKYGGMLTIEEGLARSNNCVSAWIMKRVGPQSVIDLAGSMGVDTSNIEPYPSICLGTPDISVYEMVGAFSTFGNKGVWVEPTFLTRIEAADGTVLEEFVPREVEVLDESYNYVILNMLMNTTRLKGGTGLRLRGSKYGFRNEIAAKTGTTQNNSDGWFIGVLPQITAGCWVGAEDRSVHFRSIHYGQGANMALPVWALFVKKVYADSSLGIQPIPFEKPLDELPVEIDCSEYYNNEQENDVNSVFD